jgi:hypothetical protein
MRAQTTLLVIAMLAASSLARADGATATAQSLFDRGKAAMTKGDYATACPLFAESQRIEPSGGTILHLAACHEGQGKTATAWAEFNQALSFARRDGRADREKAARDRIAALEPKLTKLVIQVPKPVSGLDVTVDGVVVGATQWGSPSPVDPGSHAIVARAPGRKTISATVETRGEGTTTTYTLAELDALPAEASAAPTPSASSSSLGPSAAPSLAPQPASTQTDAPPARPLPLKTIGIVTAGVGLVAVGVGAYFGLVAKSKNDDSNAAGACALNTCPQAAYDLRNDSIAAANASTFLFVAGGVLVAAGVTLFIVAPRGDARAARIEAAPIVGRANGLGLRGSW